MDMFYDFADAMATENPGDLHHVYEWGEVGAPEGRLFELLTTTGSNQFSTRIGFDFLISQVPRPAVDWIEEQREHYFYYKAWLFEQGGSTTITPLYAKAIPILTEDGSVIFRPRTEITYPTRNIGAFQRIWNTYWNAIAPEYIRIAGLQPIERTIGQVVRRKLGNAGSLRGIIGGARRTVGRGGYMPATVTITASGTQLDWGAIAATEKELEGIVLARLMELRNV